MKRLSRWLCLLASIFIGCFGLIALPQATIALSVEKQSVRQIVALDPSVPSIGDGSSSTVDEQKIDLNNAN